MQFFRHIFLAVLICLQISCQTATGTDGKTEAISENGPLSKEPKNRADRDRWREILKWPDECERKTEFYGKDFIGIEFHKIGPGRFIAHVDCSLGWYQGDQLFYLVDETAGAPKATLLEFEQFAEIEEEGEDGSDPDAGVEKKEENVRFRRFFDPLVFGTVTVDAANRRIVNLNRYRGPGGCGTMTVYDIGGDVPKTVEFRARTTCSEEIVPAERWKAYPLRDLRKPE